jgi:hypothetical protein
MSLVPTRSDPRERWRGVADHGITCQCPLIARIGNRKGIVPRHRRWDESKRNECDCIGRYGSAFGKPESEGGDTVRIRDRAAARASAVSEFVPCEGLRELTLRIGG